MRHRPPPVRLVVRVLWPWPWLAAVALLVGACQRREAAAATPKQVAATFYKAMDAGDLAAAKAASVGDERSERWLEAVVEHSAARRGYHDALKARFGADADRGQQPSDVAAGGEADVLKAIADGEEKVEGDSATILRTADRRKVVHLKRVNGKWKVDRGPLGDAESVDRFVDRTRRTAKVYRDLAEEVRRNDYKSLADARQAFGERLVPAMKEMPPGNP